MKKIFLATILLALIAPVYGQGIVFEEISFQQALDKAGRENKYVFVDCYTSWCGPCKKMTNDVFTRKNVGDYFALRFISLKYDVEKEEEGIRLRKEHKVNAFPTYLIFNPDGTLLYQFKGAADAPKFLRNVDEAFDDGRAYNSLKKSYESAGSHKEILGDVLEQFKTVRDPQTRRAIEELSSQLSDKEKTSSDYWFIYSIDLLDTIGSKNEEYLFANAERFRKNIGKEEVDPVLERHYQARFSNIIRLEEEISKKDMDRLVKQVRKLRLGGDINAFTNIALAVKTDDFDEMIRVAKEEIPGMEYFLEAYFYLTDRIKDRGTPIQKEAWIELGENLILLAPDDKRAWIQAAVNHIRK